MSESKKRIGIIVSGYFSPLHVGHLDLIQDAAAGADDVIVIVNNNAQQQMKKGKVIMDEADRLRIVLALRAVDYAFVAIDDDRTVSASLAKVAAEFPDHRLIFANGGDRNSDEIVPETDICREQNIEMIFDMGGTRKADSSSRINVEMGLEDEPSAPPSEST